MSTLWRLVWWRLETCTNMWSPQSTSRYKRKELNQIARQNKYKRFPVHIDFIKINSGLVKISSIHFRRSFDSCDTWKIYSIF